MPDYFFHLRDGEDVLLDPDGRQMDTIDAITAAALLEARAIIGEEARAGAIALDKRIDVEDASGTIVHSLHFVDAVQISGLPST